MEDRDETQNLHSSSRHLGISSLELEQSPTIQFRQLLIRNTIASRVKIVEITQQKPAGIPNLSIGLDEMIQDLLGDPKIITIILRCHPQTQDFCARLFDHVLRRDDVAGRLRHLLALPIEHKAMGQNRLVGRAMIGDDAGQQGAVEPASMLIRPFEVEIGRPPLPSLSTPPRN